MQGFLSQVSQHITLVSDVEKAFRICAKSSYQVRFQPKMFIVSLLSRLSTIFHKSCPKCCLYDMAVSLLY